MPEGDNNFLLDVRSEEEFEEGTAPSSINVPHDKIDENLRRIPKDKKILVFCKSGKRAEEATNKLRWLGYNAENIKTVDKARQRAKE